MIYKFDLYDICEDTTITNCQKVETLPNKCWDVKYFSKDLYANMLCRNQNNLQIEIRLCQCNIFISGSEVYLETVLVSPVSSLPNGCELTFFGMALC